MSAASPQQPSAKERPGDTSLLEDCSEGDELPSEAAAAAAAAARASTDAHVPQGGGGADDGAVRRYSREELMDMRLLPLSKIRPECLSKKYKARQGTFLIDSTATWDANKKRSETPSDEDRGRDMQGDKRRSGDPRERIRKESEGIVLSPQRRSFTSGCFVVAGAAGAQAPPGPQLREARLRPDSPLFSQGDTGAQKNSDQGNRENSRRIGSGRILSRDLAPWERGGEAGGDAPSDYTPYRPPGATRERERGEDRFERRSFGRDMYGNNTEKNRNNDRDRDRDRDMGEGRFNDRRDRDDNRQGRYNNRRRYDKEEEPEWFSAGPTSQHETIELRGFDDPVPPVPPAAGAGATEGGAARARPARRSAGSGRTPSAMAANQPKEAASKIGDKFDEESEKKKVRSGASPTPSETAKSKESEEKSGPRQNAALEGAMKMDAPPDFNIEDFLKLDDIPGLLTNGGSDEGLSGGSRFSQWFRRDSPPAATPAPAEAAAPDHIFANILNGKSNLEPSISIPSGDSQHLFAPISPAASSTPAPNSLLEMLQRGLHQHQHQQQQQAQPGPGAAHQPPQQHPPHQQHHHQQMHQQQFHHHKPAMDNMSGKVHSVEELEARMRGPPTLQHTAPQPPQLQHLQRAPHHHAPPQDDEINAFKRLLAQVSGGHAAPTSNGPISSKSQPMSLLQMLNKSQQADQAALEAQHHQHQHQAPMVSHELLCKLLQVQQISEPNERHDYGRFNSEAQQQHPMEQSKMMQGGNLPNHSSGHFQVSPIPSDLQAYMSTLQPSRELLQRPEAQAIIDGLKQGQITPQHLLQQMNNQGMQSRHREVVASILKLHQQQASPRASLGLPAQQPSISPLPLNAYCVSPIMATSPNTLAVHHPAMPQRIPSPRELQAHTQSIMQGALIKKKLEEQRENYLRRQEQSTPAAPSPSKHQALAFTPTSVLRKMTAEKESEPVNMLGSSGKAAGWGAPPPHMPQPMAPKQGRPIVKGNSGGMGVPVFQPSPAEYPPAQYLNHQQHQQQQFVTSLQQRQEQVQQARGKQGSVMHPSQQHAALLQMRQQHQHHHPQAMPQVNNRGGPMAGAPAPNALHQLLMHSHQNVRVGGPALSPTSNQLARWFSPELLAQATAGKLPSVNLAQNALSLEELERMQHNEAIVRN